MSESEPTARPTQAVEYPDAAGYPDGTGTLDEGTGDVAETGENDVSTAIEDFAMTDEEDVDN